MDNIDLRRKTGISTDFSLSLMLITGAFILGAVCMAMLRMPLYENIMSIRQAVKMSGWICLAALLFADAACAVMPAARVFCVLLSAACGSAAACISYLYSESKLFSTDFFAFAAVVLAFSAATAYVSDCVFTLAPKLRGFIRADRRLRHELNMFCAVSAALMLTAFVSAAVFIL